MRAFVRSLLGCLIICGAAWVLLDLRVWHGPLHAWLMQGRGALAVAEVGGVPITQPELQEALRDHLWQRGESWTGLSGEARKEARRQVLESLVAARLIRAARLREEKTPWEVQAGTRRESDLMRRQFTTADDLARRLALQGQTQKSLDERIREMQWDEAWLAAKIAPALADIARREAPAWHERFKETLRIPAAHHVAHLFLSRNGGAAGDRGPEISRIHRQIVEGKSSFVVLVQKHSEDARTKKLGGDLGWVTRQRMPADFMTAVEKAKVGQVSTPVTTALGWHLILVSERRPSRVPALEEMKEEIVALLASQHRQAAAGALLADLRRQSGPQIVLHAEIIDHTEPAR